MPRRPLVLLTNDDGYGAEGLEAMAEGLLSWADVLIVAPQVEQSACSHKLTLNQPLKLREVGVDRWVVDGTPADCVYLGIHRGPPVGDRSPELVVSGVNRGVNLGLDIHYSGTVAAAREAAMRGVSGLAVSADPKLDPVEAARLGAVVARAMLTVRGKKAPEDLPLVLNMNVPKGAHRGLVSTRLGRRYYEGSVDVRKDPRGGEYLWIGGTRIRNDSTAGTDTAAFTAGLVGLSRVPLLPDDCLNDGALREVIETANEVLLAHVRG